MSENRKFKLKYDELREGNPAKQPDEDAASSSEITHEHYNGPGNIRNLTFAWPDGRRMFLNYAYLVACELSTTDEKNMIVLHFTSHVLTLKGYELEKLFVYLGNQTASIVNQIDPRYIEGFDEKNCVVTEISVEQNR
jgi:hypothetical protein